LAPAGLSTKAKKPSKKVLWPINSPIIIAPGNLALAARWIFGSNFSVKMREKLWCSCEWMSCKVWEVGREWGFVHLWKVPGEYYLQEYICSGEI